VKIDMQSIERKLCFLTGAAGGIGRAMAQTLAAESLRLILVDCDASGLAEIVAEIGDQATPLVLDLADADAIVPACEAVRATHGPVDILVNNAGIARGEKSAQTDAALWRQVMAVNLDAPFLLARHWLPAMRERRWGRIVNMCSMSQKTGGMIAGTAYTASKGGLGALTFALAREVAAEGVTVNAIAPGFVPTPMVLDDLGADQIETLKAQTPTGRLVTPEEIAHAVRFLISPLAGSITGEILDVNSGIYMD
jgi:3-oxoacyl-[acyl-carrier protein] reductase